MRLNFTKVFVIIIVAILATASVVGGAVLLQKDQSSGDRKLIDSAGRDVYLPDEIETIFCEDCCTLEMLSWFKSIDKVCGIDSRDKIISSKTYTQVFKEKLKTLPVVDISSAEYVIRLNPSVVICSTADVQKISYKQSQYNVPVFYINADVEFDSDIWYDQIIKLGQLLHEESRAKEIVDGVKAMRAELSSYDCSTNSAYVCGMMYYGAGNYLKTTGDYIPFDWIRLKNSMPSKGINHQPYNTSIESIVAANFDYIFVDGSNVDSVRNELKNELKPLASEKKAFINNDIYSTLTYKVWGTQWDNQLINCYFIKCIVTGEDTLKEDVNKVLHLFYGDGIDYDTIKQWNPKSFERLVM